MGGFLTLKNENVTMELIGGITLRINKQIFKNVIDGGGFSNTNNS